MVVPLLMYEGTKFKVQLLLKLGQITKGETVLKDF